MLFLFFYYYFTSVSYAPLNFLAHNPSISICIAIEKIYGLGHMQPLDGRDCLHETYTFIHIIIQLCMLLLF